MFYAISRITLWRLLVTFSLTNIAIKAITNPFTNPFTPPEWDVKTCSVLIKNPDGTVNQTSFVPKDTTVKGCFKWSWTAQNHPKNCPNWREPIRDACKAAFEKETNQSSLSSFFKRLSGPQAQNIAFEGCVESFTPAGIIRGLDWSLKKAADALGSDSFKKCTTEPDPVEEPESAPNQDQQAPPIQETIKHVPDLEDQPSQLYLNKPKLQIPKSTSYLVPNIGITIK